MYNPDLAQRNLSFHMLHTGVQRRMIRNITGVVIVYRRLDAYSHGHLIEMKKKQVS